MVSFTTKPIEEKEPEELKQILQARVVEVSPHAFDHISSVQRKVFKEDELIQTAQRETPRKAYLQVNGRYVGYYRKESGYRKLIFDVQEKKAVIVTFMDVDELPKVDFQK